MAATLLPGAAACYGGDLNRRGRFACNSWPFRAYFDTPEMHAYRDAKYPLLQQWDFPEFLADHFGIHNVELLPQHFLDTSPATIERVKQGLTKAKSTCCNLMGVELAGGVFNANADQDDVLRNANRWIGVAVDLGAPTLTIALTGKGTPDAHAAASNLLPVVNLAARHGKKVLFHNDDIVRESAEILTALVTELGRNRTGTCPDFGNFAVRSPAYALHQLRMLAPYASSICHAKDGIADRGTFYRDDFAGSMKAMQDSGFHGIYSLEFEGLGDPLEGVRKLMQLTEEYLV